ncbi:MAG: AAA family ATPase [Byssovorax sp.]
MKLDRLHLSNFRGFEDLTLDLHRSLTVLVGANGAGKTSVLQALEIASSHFVAAALGEDRRARAIEDRDIRFGHNACQIELLAGDMKLSISHTLGQPTLRTPQTFPTDTTPPLTVALHVDRSILKTPMISAPGTRMWARVNVVSPRPAWDDVINTDFTSFEHFEGWFREQEDLENQDRVRTRNLEYENPGLAAVRRAIERVLQTCSDIRIDRAHPLLQERTQIVLNKEGQEVSGDQLSDGERSLLVIASTLARRLTLLDRGEDDPLRREAVVIIDEIELHLHPAWQREIVPRLLETFPSCQFVVTTHSPQVLSSVPRESIVILDHFKAYQAATPTRGRDSSAILADVMGVSIHPKDIADKLDVIASALDHEDHESAKIQIEALAAELGDLDHEVVRLRSLLSFLEA